VARDSTLAALQTAAAYAFVAARRNRRPGSPCHGDTEYPFERQQRENTLLTCPPGEGSIYNEKRTAVWLSSIFIVFTI